MDKKLQVYHFHNGGGGGVLSVIRNLLKYSEDPAIENHVIYTINKDLKPVYSFEHLEGAQTEQVFYYSPTWNFYYTCKRLAKLLPDNKAAVVAHDWLELGMMSILGLQNPVVQIVHGNYDYYFRLAKSHSSSVDRYICISPVIYKKLCAELPGRKNDVHYCRFPVPSVQVIEKNNHALKIFYCVRSLDDENKGFEILPRINARLKLKEITVHWTIIGDGIEKPIVVTLMNQQSGILFFKSLSNEEVIKRLPSHDLFILPSLQEGFPVSVVEAMKAGVVPLVTDWDGATDELIIPGETGYHFKPGDVNGYADAIELLNTDRTLLRQMYFTGIKKANELFDPVVNTKNIEAVISKACNLNKKIKQSCKVYGSRLDQPWLPNFVSHTFRNVFKKS